MIVYIEDTIIVNVLLNFIILFLTSKICFSRTKVCFIILSALIGSILAVFYPLLNVSGVMLLAIKTIISLVMLIIAFRYTNLKKLIFEILVFYGVTALFGGAIIAININFNITNNTISFILLSSILIFYLSNIVINTFLKKKKHNEFLYKTKIEDNGKEVEILAYLDSGNNIKDNEGKPIFVITTEVFIKLFGIENLIKVYAGKINILKNATYIKIGTVVKEDTILTFTVDKVFVENENKNIEFKNASVGISKVNLKNSFGCDMLLHPDIIGELK